MIIKVSTERRTILVETNGHLPELHRKFRDRQFLCCSCRAPAMKDGIALEALIE
jgi:hypothetical protein